VTAVVLPGATERVRGATLIESGGLGLLTLEPRGLAGDCDVPTVWATAKAAPPAQEITPSAISVSFARRFRFEVLGVLTACSVSWPGPSDSTLGPA
jgi:hypothetical protein